MSGMTDAQKLADEYRPSMTLEVLHSWAEEAVSHLRGEAQAEQPIAWVSQCDCMLTPDYKVTNPILYGSPEFAPDPDRVVPLYTRPQAALSSTAAPAPVAGDADAMCPNCVTPWKCNGPHEESGAVGEFDGYTLVPTSNLRRIADELGMEGGIYAPKLRREVLAYIEVSPSLFAEAQPPAVGVDVSEASIFCAADALCGEWNLHYPDAVRMAKTALNAALRTGGGE